jgi:hypothetical protein
MRPKMKKCFSSMMHWSDERMHLDSRSFSGTEKYAAGADGPKHIGNSSWYCPQVVHTNPVIFYAPNEPVEKPV